MVDVPDVIPFMIPVKEPIVATAVTPLLQVPPVVVLLNVVLELAQTDAAPEIAAGNGLTVTTAVLKQPVGTV